MHLIKYCLYFPKDDKLKKLYRVYKFTFHFDAMNSKISHLNVHLKM